MALSFFEARLGTDLLAAVAIEAEEFDVDGLYDGFEVGIGQIKRPGPTGEGKTIVAKAGAIALFGAVDRRIADKIIDTNVDGAIAGVAGVVEYRDGTGLGKGGDGQAKQEHPEQTFFHGLYFLKVME